MMRPLFCSRKSTGELGGEEVPVEMHFHHQVPLFLGHVVYHLVAENAGVVDQYIQLAEFIHGGFDNVLAAGQRGHRVVVGYGFSAFLLDFVYTLSAADVEVRYRQRYPEVIDHHFGALGCQRQRFTPADAAAGAGDHSYFAFQSIAHF